MMGRRVAGRWSWPSQLAVRGMFALAMRHVKPG